MHPFRHWAIALSGLPAVFFASVASASADVLPFTSAQATFCDSFATPCPQPGISGVSFVAGTPASASFNRGFVIDGFRNLAVTSSMAVDQGFFSAYGAAEGSATGIQSTTNGVSANGYGTDLDYLTISSGAVLHVPLHLTGGVNIGYSVGGSFVFSPGTVFAYVSLDLTCSARNADNTGPITNCSQNFDYFSSTDVDTVLDLVIPFTPGVQFYFQLSPTLIAGLGLPGIDSTHTADISGHAIGDFSHTVVFCGATVFDAFGNPLPDAVIDSASGFNYRTGFVTSSAPEPATLALLGLGVAGLGALRRRPRRLRAA